MLGRGPSSPYGSFKKKKPTGKGTCQGCNRTNKVGLPVRAHQHPPWSCDRIPRRPTVWGHSCQTHSRKAVGHRDGSFQEHSPSATLGSQAWDSPCYISSPRSGNHRLLKRKTMEVSLSYLGGHSTPLTPYGMVTGEAPLEDTGQ